MASAKSCIQPLFNRLYHSRFLTSPQTLQRLLHNGHSNFTDDNDKILRNPSRVLSYGGMEIGGISLISKRWLFSKRPMKSKAPFNSKAPMQKTNENNKVTESEDNKDDDDDENVVYKGPKSEIIRNAKLVSLSACCLSITLCPAVTFLTCTPADVAIKGTIAASIIFLTASTFKAFDWIFGPYVQRVKWAPYSSSVEVEVISWLGGPVPRTVHLSEVGPPDRSRPLANFKARGYNYYIDGEHFHNKDLLGKLLRR